MNEVWVERSVLRGARPEHLRQLKKVGIPRLQGHPQSGAFIARRLRPARFGSSQNLYRLRLPGGLRALCSMDYTDPDARILIKGLGTHKEYERRMGYQPR